MRTEKQKMLAGELYDPRNPELVADRQHCQQWLQRYNSGQAMCEAERQASLELYLGSAGQRLEIRPPFYCDYGYNIHLGDGVFLNFNCVILDVVEVRIGAGTQIGSGVQILTADHPREAQTRARGLEFGRPVRIGANVWIGSGALLLPGVSIGDGAVVGAGSVVTRDVPAGATAMGNPARLKGSAGIA